MMRFPDSYIFSSKTFVISVCCAIILLALTVIFVTTKTPSYPLALTTLDTLSDRRPDLASEKLVQYVRKHNSMSSADRWYCRFLLFKTAVKQNSGIKNDREAKAILAHYESEADERMLQQVYYYVGTTYNLLGDAPQAMEYLHKGMQLTLQNSKTEELRALYYYMMGELLTYQHLDKDALAMHLRAYDIFKRHNNYQRMAYECIAISWSLKALGKLNASISNLEKARILAIQHSMLELLPEIECQLADRYYDLGKYKLAKKHIDISLSAKNGAFNSSTLTVAANISVALNDYDKAMAYYARIIESGTIYSKQLAYKFMAEYFSKKNDKVKAYEYSMKYCDMTNEIVQLTSSEYSARANAMFNYRFIEKEKDNLLLKLKLKNKIVAFSVIILILSILFVCYYFYVSRQRQRKLEFQLLSVRNRSDRTLAQYRARLEDLSNKLNSVKDEQSDSKVLFEQKEVERLLKKYELQNKVRSTAECIWKSTEIYKRLDRICRKRENVTENTVDWDLLEETLFDIFPTFRDGLMDFKRMKSQAYHVCLLIKAGFGVQEIAFLTVKSPEAINSTRRRLYETNLGKEGKPSEWDEVIRSL